MSALSIHTIGNEVVIRLNKENFSDAYLMSLLRRLRLEELAQKAQLDEQLISLAEEINRQWWEENNQKFLDNTNK